MAMQQKLYNGDTIKTLAIVMQQNFNNAKKTIMMQQKDKNLNDVSLFVHNNRCNKNETNKLEGELKAKGRKEKEMPLENMKQNVTHERKSSF